MGAIVENLFVRILNSALLIFALLCLIVTVGVLGFAGFSLARSLSAETSSERISIRYQPSNIVSATGERRSGSSVSAQISNPDLLKAARASCDATEAVIRFISKGQLGIADAQRCRDGEISSSSNRYEGRAENYLLERADYLRAAIADSQARAMFNVAEEDDIQAATERYLGQLQTQFDQKFDAAVAEDDARKSRELETSVAGKAEAFTLAGAAAVAFTAFLVVAFLLVAVRLEKHVRKIADSA